MGRDFNFLVTTTFEVATRIVQIAITRGFKHSDLGVATLNGTIIVNN